jgi:hypothetical protein
MSDIQDLIHKTSMDCIERGKLIERKRIIKLFQDEDRRNYEPCEHSPKGFEAPCGGCQYFFDPKSVIALIIGETNG